MGLPTLDDWTRYMLAKSGEMGSGLAWPLAKGEAEIEPITYGLQFSIGDLEDSGSEYSDGDEELEEVGGDWWQTVAVPSMWRLVEQHITAFGYSGIDKSKWKRMWSDPVVTTIGMGNLNPLERLFIA